VLFLDNIKWGYSRGVHREENNGIQYLANRGNEDGDVSIAMIGRRWVNGGVITVRTEKNDRIPKYTMPKYFLTDYDPHSKMNKIKFEKEGFHNLAMGVYDAGGKLLDQATIEEVKDLFQATGAIHVQNTGITSGDASLLASQLGFRAHQFEKTVNTDHYPHHLMLLPHNDNYLHGKPEHLMFIYDTVVKRGYGGRIGLHNGVDMMDSMAATAHGDALLTKLSTLGVTTYQGYQSKALKEITGSHARSWEDKFETADLASALAKYSGSCVAKQHTREELDEWIDSQFMSDESKTEMKRKAGELEPHDLTTLMVRSHTPGTPLDMVFPQIALDGPDFHNAHRNFKLGDVGEEKDLEYGDILAILEATTNTMQSLYAEPGDVILVDNSRFAHSREAYDPEVLPDGKQRKVLLAMSGEGDKQAVHGHALPMVEEDVQSGEISLY
jgi:hypothetical protein